MAEERGLWLKRVKYTYPLYWWDDRDTNPDKLHWFPVKRNEDTGWCWLDLTDAVIDSIPDEVLPFISELDEVRLMADGIEASLKTSTLHKLQSHKKLHLYIEGRGNMIPPSYLAVLPNVDRLTIGKGCGPLELAEGDRLCLTGMTSLVLSGCGIREIPHWFSAIMSGLLELILSKNYLSELPESFRNFSSLKSLDMAEQQGNTQINLRKLYLPRSLEKLTLAENGVPGIPDDFCSSLTLLQSLTMTHDPLTIKPDNSYVCVLPPSINCMKALTALDLQGHRLDALPSTFADLHHLTDISLSRNKFSSFPLVLLSLIGLKRLNMSYNIMTELPDESGQLYKLQVLDMSHNRLRRLPVSLWSVDGLRELMIAGNPLDSVGEASIVKRTHLWRLVLPFDVLSLFDLASLSSLSQLTLTSQTEKNQYFLPSMPAKMMELQYLTELEACFIGLVTIPDDICSITSLRHVDVSSNQLECLPPNIGRLTRLRSLDASENKITSVPGQLWKINSLSHVSLANNLLTEIDPPADYLKSCTQLSIELNQLRYLPTAFSELSLSQTMRLYCFYNPLLFPPFPLIPIYVDNFTVVCSFMKEVARFGSVRCGTLKVLVLGSYKAGKTSIVLSIINQQPSLTDPDDRTISIDRFDWQVATKDDHTALTVRFFDGGGQHTYAMTNQLFMTEQSLTMIVVDAHTYDKAQDKCEAFQRLVGFYLDNVLDRNPAAVCLVVVAQADRVGFAQSELLTEDIRQRCLCALDRRIQDCEDGARQWISSYFEEVKTCMSFVCVSAAVDTATHSGMSQLQALLASYGHNVELFPSVEYILPTSWHSLEQHLERHEDLVSLPYCTGIQMRKIASQLGLQIETVKFVVDYLHGIGSVLFYENDPVLRQVVFHHLPFLVSVFKAIFRHDIAYVNYDSTLSRLHMSPHRFQKLKSDLLRDGVATLSLVIALMESVKSERNVCLSRASVKAIIRLMEYFDLCYWLTEAPPSFQMHEIEAKAVECSGTFEVVEDDHNRRLLIPWLLDHSVTSRPAEVALYFGAVDPNRFVVVEARVCFPFHLPSALFDRLSARCHRHQTYLRHWSRGALSVCGPLAMLLTQETETKSIVVKVKTPRSCECRRRIWQLLLRVLVDLKELCMSLAGAVSEGHIMLRSFNEINAGFHISLQRQGLQAIDYQTLKFHISGHPEGYREVEMLSPDEGQCHVVSSSFLVILSDCVETIDDVKAEFPLSACLPEKMECRLLPDDLRKAAKLMGAKCKQFVNSEELKESIAPPQQLFSTTADGTSVSALKKWQHCYGPFAVPCVLVESLCDADLVDIAVQMFGYSIPRQEVVSRESHEGAVAVNVRALDGLVTRAEYMDVLDHLSSVFASSWRSLGRSLGIRSERLDHYERFLCNNRDIVHEMVLEWYRRDGVVCTLAALLDKCERLQPNCRVELVSLIPKNTPDFRPPEPLVLMEEVLDGTACSLCFVIVSMTANQTVNWCGLARRLGMHTKNYEGRYPLVSDILYDILEDWMRREESATVRCLLDACGAVDVRGAVEHELKKALDSKTGLCGERSCRLCYPDD